MARRILLFALVIFFALLLGFGLPRQWLKPLFHYTGYYFMLAAFVLWAALVLKISHSRFFSFIKSHYPALLLSFLLMILIFYMNPPKFKVLADETNLIGVSMAMHHEKTVSVPLQGLALDYYDFDYDHTVDKRPLLFPFMASVFHGLFGYRPGNGFVVNFIFGGLVLFLMYLLAAHAFSRFYGFLAILLTAAFPIFVFWVTSSGFEILNLFYVLFALLVLYRFIKTRHVDHAGLLFLSLVLLACCRYESILFFIGLIVAVPYLLNRRIIYQYRFPTYVFPLLLLPMIWQRRIAFYSAIVRKGAQYDQAGQVFGLSNVFEHFSDNIFVLSGLDPGFGFLPVVSVAAIAGGYLIAKRLLLAFKEMTAENRTLVSYGLITGGLLFLVYTAFYFGNFTRPVSNRLALVFVPFLVIAALYLLRQLIREPAFYVKTLAIFLAGIHLVFYRPAAADQKIVDGLSLTYEYGRVVDYLHKNFDMKTENLLLISDLPNLYVIWPLGSVDFSYASRNQDKLAFYNKIYYDHILVLQRYSPKTGKIKPDNTLDAACQRKPLKRLNISPAFYIRISEAIFRSH